MPLPSLKFPTSELPIFHFPSSYSRIKRAPTLKTITASFNKPYKKWIPSTTRTAWNLMSMSHYKTRSKVKILRRSQHRKITLNNKMILRDTFGERSFRVIPILLASIFGRYKQHIVLVVILRVIKLCFPVPRSVSDHDPIFYLPLKCLQATFIAR